MAFSQALKLIQPGIPKSIGTPPTVVISPVIIKWFGNDVWEVLIETLYSLQEPLSTRHIDFIKVLRIGMDHTIADKVIAKSWVVVKDYVSHYINWEYLRTFQRLKPVALQLICCIVLYRMS